MKILKKIYSLHILLRIALYISFLFVIWLIFYLWLKKLPVVYYFYEEGFRFLSILTLKTSQFFLGILGYKTEVYAKIIKIGASYGVHLDKGCLGRNTILIFVSFILAYPGDVKSKIWFIPLGIFVFFILNVLRISALVIIDYCCREYLDFNHHATFKIITYLAILLMWVFWIKKYGSKE